MRRLVVIDAPSHLGLRPPDEGTVPGWYTVADLLQTAVTGASGT